jgi:hypothetical protein
VERLSHEKLLKLYFKGFERLDLALIKYPHAYRHHCGLQIGSECQKAKNRITHKYTTSCPPLLEYHQKNWKKRKTRDFVSNTITNGKCPKKLFILKDNTNEDEEEHTQEVPNDPKLEVQVPIVLEHS